MYSDSNPAPPNTSDIAIAKQLAWGRAEQFFGIGALGVLEARLERIRAPERAVSEVDLAPSHSLTLPTQRACGSHVDGSFSTPPKIHSWRPPPHRRPAALLLAADDLAVRQRLFLTMLGNRNPDRAQRRSGYRSWQKWRERHGRRARTYRSLVLHENLRSDKSMDRRALRLKVCFAESARRDGRLRA